MKKLSKRWIVTYVLLAVTLIILIAVLVVKLPQIKQYNKVLEARNTTEENAEFLANSTVESNDEAPYLESGIDGIYYTANYDGDIKFYKFSNGQFESLKISDTKVFKLAGDTNASVKISFVTINDQTVGFGVYSAKDAEKTPYAFIKVIPNKITENYDYIAFVDYTVEDYYSNNKTYETAYVFSSKEDPAEIFSLEDSTAFIPVDLIQSRNDGFYYFSKNEDGTYNLFLKTTVFGKEYPVSETLALPYAFSKNGALYLLETEKIEGVDSDTTFYLVESGSIEPSPIKQFKSEISSYLVKDNYIFNPQEKTLFDVTSEAEQTMNIEVSLTEVTDFDVTLGCSRIAITGKVDDKSDMLLLYEFATDSIKLIGGNNLFLTGNPNITVTDSYIMFLSPATTADYINNIVIPWEKVF